MGSIFSLYICEWRQILYYYKFHPRLKTLTQQPLSSENLQWITKTHSMKLHPRSRAGGELRRARERKPKVLEEVKILWKRRVFKVFSRFGAYCCLRRSCCCCSDIEFWVSLFFPGDLRERRRRKAPRVLEISWARSREGTNDQSKLRKQTLQRKFCLLLLLPLFWCNPT